MTLLGVALFHKHTMYVALAGLIVIISIKILTVPDFSLIHHLAGFEENQGEWKTLLNLAGLQLGFAVLAKYFELSGVPNKLPAYLTDDWKGGLVLLLIINGWHPVEKRGRRQSENTLIIDQEPSGEDICKTKQDCFNIS